MGNKPSRLFQIMGLSFFLLLSACEAGNSSLSESSSDVPSSSSESSQTSSENSSSSSSEASSSSESSSSVSSSSEESSSSSSSIPTVQTISFETNGGSLVNPLSGMPGSSISQPSSPSRNGYTFAGWYAEPGLSTPYIFSTIPGDSITVYADWETNYMIFSVVSGTDLKVNANALYNPAVEIWVPKFHQGALVTAIDVYGFYGLRNITRIKLPDSINQIGNQAFAGDMALTAIDVFGQGSHFNSVNGILYSVDSTTLVNYPIGKTETSFTIPEGVITLGESAFENASNITQITFATTLKTVSQKAFMNCHNLDYVVINEGLETIGEYAFYWTALENVLFPSTLSNLAVNAFDATGTITAYGVAQGNTHFKGVAGDLYNYDQTTLIRYAVGKPQTTFTLPFQVTTIGPSAFKNSANLTQIILPFALEKIDDYAFLNCGALIDIDIPVSVSWIGGYAFRNCETLPGIYIPSNVTHMGHWVFDGCTAIHIYVQAFNPGSGWDSEWNAFKPVTWAYGE